MPRVKRVTKLAEKQLTVDVEVSGTHSYQLSNGWVSHNTVSQLVDCSSGIHSRYSEYYIRTVRADIKDPLAKMMMDMGFPWEKDLTKPDHVVVFSFPIKSPDGAITTDKMTAVDQLELWKMYQHHWCEHKPSCFSGSTRFVTDKGLVSFDDTLAGREAGDVVVMNRRGKFVPATARRFGKDEVWEVHLTSGKNRMVVETTASHLWPTTYAAQRWAGWPEKMYRTDELPIGKQLVSVYPDMERKFILEAFLRGVVFGDGSQYNKHRKKNRYCKVDLCGESRELAPFFEKFGRKPILRNDIDQTRVYGLPGHWKELPTDRFQDGDYIYSFIMGWFAADGYVSERGDVVSISCTNRDALLWLQRVAPMAGIACSTTIGTRKYGDKSTVVKPIKNGNDKCYCLGFVKEAVPESFFVRTKHLARFVRKGQSSKRWRIEKVLRTGRKENVYCVVEPEGSHFVLEGSVLTHNCTIHIKENEWMEVGAWVYRNFDEVSGVAFLPHSSHVYKQSPYQSCTKEEYEKALAAMPKNVDWDKLKEYESDDSSVNHKEIACTGASCELVDLVK
jgi:hypothetical protein